MRAQKFLELLVKELNAPLGFPVRIGENGLPLHLGGIDNLVSLGPGLGNNVLGVALLLPEPPRAQSSSVSALSTLAL